ncbi:MAG: hypothetical protein PVJ39_17615 [Gammaproteobacteria bacterium]|jgi:hypothetical protein
MAYRLTITQKPSYIHIVITGRNSKNTAMRYLKDVLHVCRIRKCRKLLIEERLKGPRLKEFPIYEIVKNRSEDARGQFDAIAYVDVNAKGDLMKFAETVAVNRGIPVTVFSTVAEAECWLEDIAKNEKQASLRNSHKEPTD